MLYCGDFKNQNRALLHGFIYINITSQCVECSTNFMEYGRPICHLVTFIAHSSEFLVKRDVTSSMNVAINGGLLRCGKIINAYY